MYVYMYVCKNMVRFGEYPSMYICMYVHMYVCMHVSGSPGGVPYSPGRCMYYVCMHEILQ
jgi:hypothetical protein